MHPPDQWDSPPPFPAPQLSLPGFGLAANPMPERPMPERLPTDQFIAPGAVWAHLDANQRVGIRRIARRICQELLHDRHDLARCA
jgi:hypothetical protein